MNYSYNNRHHFIKDNNSTNIEYDNSNGLVFVIFLGAILIIYFGCYLKKNRPQHRNFDNFEDFEQAIRDAELPTYEEVENDLPSYDSIT